MQQGNGMPKVLGRVRTARGAAFELRWDPMGVLELPGAEDVLVCLHVGAPAKLACRRAGRSYAGTAVHGDVDIIPAHTPMRWEMRDQKDRALILRLPQALVRAVAVESGVDGARVEVRDRFQIRDAGLEALGWALKGEMETGYQSGRLYLEGLALAVASRVVARHSSVATQIAEPIGGLSGRRLKQVLSFIEEYLAEDLSLERIAAVAGVSASHLNTLFRQSLGVPVHQYVIRRRVESARALLTQGGLSLAEVALAAGFAHQSHMARHLRRLLGMTPRALQRLQAEASAPR